MSNNEMKKETNTHIDNQTHTWTIGQTIEQTDTLSIGPKQLKNKKIKQETSRQAHT